VSALIDANAHDYGIAPNFGEAGFDPPMMHVTSARDQNQVRCRHVKAGRKW
jgi:hypothetical protein